MCCCFLLGSSDGLLLSFLSAETSSTRRIMLDFQAKFDQFLYFMTSVPRGRSESARFFYKHLTRLKEGRLIARLAHWTWPFENILTVSKRIQIGRK